MRTDPRGRGSVERDERDGVTSRLLELYASEATSPLPCASNLGYSST